MPTVEISLPAPAAHSYAIHIETGIMGRLGVLVHAVAAAPSAVLVTDEHVGQMHGGRARASLEAAGYRVQVITIPAGEMNKTLDTFSGVVDEALAFGIERKTPLIALGGGVVGDLAGFAAASLLRGIPFIQAPTTLLAAVDASVGGKVGVDHSAGKNLLGAFHQPRMVVTDIATFQTLPDREVRCGLAECIKHGIIRDAGLFEFIEKHLSAILGRDTKILSELVAWNVRIKAAIVREDPFEQGVRALLNLGHTFGHAMERVLDYRAIQHGEAVAVGMVAACNLAVDLGMLTSTERDRIVALIQKAGLPVVIPSVPVDGIIQAMGADKKVVGGKLRLVLPARIGDARIESGVDPVRIREAVTSVIAGPDGSKGIVK